MDQCQSKLVEVEYPVGHKLRRSEGIPKLIQKFKTNLARQFDEKQSSKILEKSLDNKILEKFQSMIMLICTGRVNLTILL